MTDVLAARSPTDLFGLDGRVAVVTGASSGLGARFARALTAAGATVVAAARRRDRLDALAAEDDRIHPHVCDVTNDADRKRLIAATIEDHGRLDVLVNNAGVSGHGDAFDEPPDHFAHVLDVNLVAPFHLACLAAQTAPDGSNLSIVNIASILGMVAGHPLGGASYAASKSGLIGLTRELAAQWGRRGTRVNALAPGWFDSEMTTDLFADERSSKWVARNTMAGRPGREDELDGALVFLASDASSYVTGQVLVIDGGWTAR